MTRAIDERITRYIQWPPLALPVTHRDGYSLCEFIGYCKSCGDPCEDIMGVVNEWPNCLQLRCAGRCEQCELVTTFEIRWTSDSMIHHSDQGWIVYPIKLSLLERIWNWITDNRKFRRTL